MYKLKRKSLTLNTPPIAVWLASLLMGIATGLCLYLFSSTWNGAIFHHRWHWFSIPTGTTTLQFSIGLYVDHITSLMLCLITCIGWLVYLYSIPFMQKERGLLRYFTFLSLFIMAILGLTLADNLLILFIFWELVGFTSYLLIGFWYQQESNAQASKKAFLMNKLGDIGLLVGLLILWSELGSFDLFRLQALVSTLHDLQSNRWMMLASLCLLGGIVAKSAQFPLFNWLPSAMVAPTPVSALMHAATMVTAGVYLLTRIAVLLPETVHILIAFIGSSTAFMGAYAAVTQYNIKQVLAYATISQLGYMVMAMGVGAYSAGLFHLTTHAFFKACLFLCVGAVTFFMRQQCNEKVDVQDMRAMGGLQKEMPVVFFAYLVASLALIGFPFFSGFFSKEAILTWAFAWAQSYAHTHHYLCYLVPLLGFATSFLTVVYIGRQGMLVFMGNARWQSRQAERKARHNKPKVPFLMQTSIIILALLSLGILYNLQSLDFNDSWLLQSFEQASTTTPSLIPSEAMPPSKTQKIVSISLAIIIFIGFVLLAIRWPLPTHKASTMPSKPLASFEKLSLYGWYLDSAAYLMAKNVIVFSKLIAKFDQKVVNRLVHIGSTSYVMMGNRVAWFDRKLVDGLVHWAASLLARVGAISQSLQNRNLQGYIFWTLVSVLLLLLVTRCM